MTPVFCIPPPLQVIGYIASHFRKDKIWLRRTRPDKRRYQVRAALRAVLSLQSTTTMQPVTPLQQTCCARCL